MKTELITGMFAIVGAIVGGFFAYITAKIGFKWDSAKKDILRLSEQVIAYHNLEKLYYEALASANNEERSGRTIMIEFRNNTELLDVERPNMTINQAKDIKKKWL